MNQLINSLGAANAPQHILAALELFQFTSSSADRLRMLSHSDQQRFFEWCDARQLTLMLSYVCNSLPQWVNETAAAKAARYGLRFERMKRELFEIVDALDDAKLVFVMLKGLSHSPALTPEANLRAQGDIDLWLPGSSAYKAREILRKLGYVPTLAAKSRHLPPMARMNRWKWRGDCFDPEMPISVELHYELWSDRAEYIQAPGVEQFWRRRKLRDFDGRVINVLCDEDLLAFAALHLLLHILHGELPLQRAWEVAYFLETHVNADGFWDSWRNLQPSALRQLQTCMFHLVTTWFGCQRREELETGFQALSPKVTSWLRTYSSAPIHREWKPNKSEVWLQLSLINERRHQLRVFARRLFPFSLPLFLDRATSARSRQHRVRALLRQLPRLFKRLVHHVAAFFPTLYDGLRWLNERKF